MIAETTSGKVEGFVLEGQHVFLGIPYAAPPLGTNRFRAPVAHEPWSGVRECFAFGPTAPQRNPGFTIIPEPVEHGDDFLNLNIYTPDVRSKLPVFVWIHGGGFVAGCNRSPWYRGTRFARDGVVVVTIGYRLGVEGFLDIEGAPPNRGVLDWIAALRWVRDTIANFGGDPSRVTIGGQSAACLTLMVSEAAQGLFGGVIAMSGTSDTRMPRDVSADAAAKVAAHLGVEPTRDAFAGFPPSVLVEAWDDAFGNPFTADAIARGFDPRAPALKPFVDGKVIREHPFRAIGASAIPLLTGSTTQEINAGVEARRADVGPIAPGALAAMVSDGDRYAAAVGSDDPVDLLAQAHERAMHPTSTFAYQFAWRRRSREHSTAMHCIDIPFVFDNLDAEGVTDEGRVGPGAPQHLADEMHAEWVSFITNRTVSWPAYGSGAKPLRWFDDRSETRDDALRAQRDLF